MTSWLAGWPAWTWGAVALVAVLMLFGLILWLGPRIEPDESDTDNDEWLRKGSS
jgi:hypothetical protein